MGFSSFLAEGCPFQGQNRPRSMADCATFSRCYPYRLRLDSQYLLEVELTLPFLRGQVRSGNRFPEFVLIDRGDLMVFRTV